MTKDIRIVIGANYGDEGKGATVNWLCNETEGKKAVVRFNGGAQAGHTVVSMNKRHVFSHFGSGTLDYIPTILTKDFVCSPHLFMREYRELMRKSVFRPDAYVSPDCPVTTPWDMMINQMVENGRGDNRHGSVGVGFGETVQRHESANSDYRLTVGDLLDRELTEKKLSSIVTQYVGQRIKELGLDESDLTGNQHPYLMMSEAVAQVFLEEVDFFLKRVNVMQDNDSLKLFDTLIFEGAQGLALDQNSKDFPHVTRSNTGIKNAMTSLRNAGILDPANVYYVTRPYLTRHGAGPLNNEQPDLKEYFDIVDETNKPHEFQGSLRFAYLDIDAMVARIQKDVSGYLVGELNEIKEINIVATCLQQLIDNEKEFPCFIYDELYKISKDSMLSEILGLVDGHYVITSFNENYYGFNQYLMNPHKVKEQEQV